jgi:acyl carrier protein
MSSKLEAELRGMVSEILEITEDKLTLDADFFDDLNVDSLKAIEIVAAFEKKYRVVIPEKDIPNIRNLGQIVKYTKNLDIQ